MVTLWGNYEGISQSDACIEKYNTGQLFGLDGIKADNPIKAKQGSSDASNY